MTLSDHDWPQETETLESEAVDKDIIFSSLFQKFVGGK